MLWKDWLGKTAEAKAMFFLKKKGFWIRHKNYRTHLGEIDIVAQLKNLLVFVEVKAISQNQFFNPEDHYDYKKRKKQIVLAKLYLARCKDEFNARFDLITVVKKERDFFIEHFESVIDETSL